MKTKTKLAIEFVLVLFCVTPVLASAFEITPELGFFPKRDIIVEPRLLIFRASLHLQGDEVWLRLWVMNLAGESRMFQIGCWIPCWGNQWGSYREQVILGPHEKFSGWLRVRPCEDGGRTTHVPVFIRVYPDDPFWRPWDLIYSGDFMLEIPDRWEYTSTVW